MTEMDPEQARMMFGILRAMMPFASGGTFRQSPPIFRESLLFPYLNGMVFALHLSQEGGMPRIHEAYASPPVSTEQILHPSKYLKEVDAPTSIALPKIAEAVGGKWRLLGSNCLGEFQISVLLKPIDPRGKYSAGWDGDRYYTFADDQSHTAVAWYSTWDTEQEAIEFLEGMERLLQQKRDATRIEAGTSSENSTATADSERAPAFRRVGMDVMMIQGFQESQRADLFAAMESVVKREKVFPRSPENQSLEDAKKE
jgi:hypothetical protein